MYYGVLAVFAIWGCIGLNLARELVTSHGGTIQAISEGTGKGSRFTVRLPLA